MPAKTTASSELIFSISTFPVFKQSTSEHASKSNTHFSGLFSAIKVYVDPVIPGGKEPAAYDVRYTEAFGRDVQLHLHTA